MKSKKDLKLAVILIILIISILFNLYLVTFEKASLEKIEKKLIKTKIDELSTEGYVKVNPSLAENSFYLSYNCSTISMTPTRDQIYSIEQALEKKIKFRPLTHDIIKTTFDHFNITVLMAKINKLEDGVFYAQLFLRKDNKILNLDIRPSDALAICLRTNADIYLKEDILEHAKKIC